MLRAKINLSYDFLNPKRVNVDFSLFENCYNGIIT